MIVRFPRSDLGALNCNPCFFVYPPILREGQAGTRRESFASRPGAGVARTRLSSEKPGPDFFFFGKSPTDSQSPGSGGGGRFRRSPLPAHSPIIWTHQRVSQ